MTLSYVHGTGATPLLSETIGGALDRAAEQWGGRDALIACHQGQRYTYADLPETIDYVLITHNHQDHCMFETLLQLRHRIKNIIVPKNNGGGLKVMGGSVGVRADVRGYTVPSVADQTLNIVEVSLGVVFGF